MTLLTTLLPPTCGACGAAGTSLCASCWRSLRPAPPAPLPPGLDRCRSLLAYEGVARTLVVRMKYRNDRGVLAWLASSMAALVAHSVSEFAVEIVTWAPTSPARRRARGYDQAALLAEGVARALQLPCRPLLVRRPGPPQTGLDRSARSHGPVFALGAGRAPPVPVLVVDDVLTTGATVVAAARALRIGGAPAVLAVTAARTSLKVPASSVDP